MTGMTEVLNSEGYKLVEDAWSEHGRRTYVHDDDATRAYQKSLATVLGGLGWVLDAKRLRTFVHPATGQLIELEPGGSETSGHFLHHMNKDA